jgi:hypothetical protein
LIGAGTNAVNFVAPGTSGNVLKSDGTSWSSGGIPIVDGSVNYAQLASDLTQVVAMPADDVDWSLGGIYTKTLTGNTTLTFSNYKLNKAILLKIDGNFTLALPNTVKNILGTYDGTVTNYIFLHCTKATSTEEVWATISQRLPTYGYFAGGQNLATADRIVFSTGVTSANTISNLSQARYGLVGVSDGTIYGYFAGGYYTIFPNQGRVITADRIVFSTGVTSVNTISNLSQARQDLGGVSDGSLYGYFAGGASSGSGYVSTADRIVFSTGVTSANTISNLSQARDRLAGLSDGSLYGYFAGGSTGAAVATTDKITFATGAALANTASDLSVAKLGPTGLSDGSTYGYFAGGHTGALVVTTDRIIFSSGATLVNTVSNLSQARQVLVGVSDGSTYGYFAGGNTGTAVTTADRIVFSSGSTSANTVSNLSQARDFFAGLSDCAV